MSEAPEATKSGGMSPLRIILFLILVTMIAALVYDWYVARPAADAAYATVEKLVTESAAKPADEGQATRDDVQKAIGKEPSVELDKDWYFVEEYHWIRGLPWQSYYVTVIYNKKDGGKTFTLANVEKNQELEDISIPGGPADPPKELHEELDGPQDPATSENGEPTPAEDTPTEDTPTEDTPAEDAPPADDPPTEETPADEAPADDTPAEDTPAEDTPAEDTPAEDTPAEDTPAEETPADEPPADDTPAEEAPADEPPPAEDAPADEPPADDAPAEDDSATDEDE